MENRSFGSKNIRSVTALDVVKCLTQIKYQRLLLECAPTSELPSNLSTVPHHSLLFFVLPSEEDLSIETFNHSNTEENNTRAGPRIWLRVLEKRLQHSDIFVLCFLNFLLDLDPTESRCFGRIRIRLRV